MSQILFAKEFQILFAKDTITLHLFSFQSLWCKISKIHISIRDVNLGIDKGFSLLLFAILSETAFGSRHQE